MKAHLTRRYWFSASHRLHSGEMSAEENRATYGKCNNPYGHGHNYALEVTVSGAVDASTGMVCNLVDLDGFMEREILARYEHVNLNTLPEFSASRAHHRKSLRGDLRNIAARLPPGPSGKGKDGRDDDELLRICRRSRGASLAPRRDLER